jgi:hypothetical protein
LTRVNNPVAVTENKLLLISKLVQNSARIRSESGLGRSEEV